MLQGRGRFVDDLQFPDTLQAAFVRSPHAHAAIRGIDTSAARELPGVHAVLTLADLAPLLSQERIPLQFRTAQLPADKLSQVNAALDRARSLDQQGNNDGCTQAINEAKQLVGNR